MVGNMTRHECDKGPTALTAHVKMPCAFDRLAFDLTQPSLRVCRPHQGLDPYNNGKCSSADLQACSRLKASPFRTKQLRHRSQSLYMPAVNRKLRSEASSKPGLADCTTLLSTDSHKLVKVRSIRAADAVGASEVQVRFLLHQLASYM